jgi:hypothetical protein
MPQDAIDFGTEGRTLTQQEQDEEDSIVFMSLMRCSEEEFRLWLIDYMSDTDSYVFTD